MPGAHRTSMSLFHCLTGRDSPICSPMVCGGSATHTRVLGRARNGEGTVEPATCQRFTLNQSVAVVLGPELVQCFVGRRPGLPVSAVVNHSDATDGGVAVLCSACESVHQQRLGAARLSSPRSGLRHSVRTLLCDRCGRVLPPVEPEEFLLKRLAQFARFGIGAESGPILSSDPE